MRTPLWSTKTMTPNRVLSALLVPLVLMTQLPLVALANQPLPTPTPPQKLLEKQAKNSLIASTVKTSTKKLTIIKPQLNLSVNPTDQELENAHVFQEPLVPMDGKANDGENSSLAAALRSFKQTSIPNDVSALSSYLSTHGKTRWSSALELNLASLRFHTGHLSEAIRLWKKVWDECKTQTGAKQMAIANRAVAQYMLVSARIGRTEEIKSLLEEVAHRPFYGSDMVMVRGAKEGLALMETAPERAFKCGPYAVGSIAELKPGAKTDAVRLACSTKEGTNLQQVRDLAKQVGLNYQMALLKWIWWKFWCNSLSWW